MQKATNLARSSLLSSFTSGSTVGPAGNWCRSAIILLHLLSGKGALPVPQRTLCAVRAAQP